jgi:hypothetical protein
MTVPGLSEKAWISGMALRAHLLWKSIACGHAYPFVTTFSMRWVTVLKEDPVWPSVRMGWRAAAM